MTSGLAGKVALVTGAGGEHGIGRAIAVKLAEDGADVAVSDLRMRPYDLNAEWQGLWSVVKEIEQLGRRAIAIQADVTDAASVLKLVNQTVEDLGRIDILVSNAGAMAGEDRCPVVELEEKEWDRVLNINAKGTYLVSQAAARQMIKQGDGGRIITMSSLSGKKGTPRFAAYCASKFGIVGFSQCLAAELAEHQITVNALCPALVETERIDLMASALRPAGQDLEEYRAQYVQSIEADIPLGRIAQPRDVANTAAFLASDQADYLTGMAITIDGGAHMI